MKKLRGTEKLVNEESIILYYEENNSENIAMGTG